MSAKIYKQRTNDAKAIMALADDYRGKIQHDLWLADGLQKDAIQNSWDARLEKKHPVDWECGISLLEDSALVCISDAGTSGLTGTKFNSDDELDKILLNKGDKREDLANFLNSNWSDKSGEEGGNRGRGKTLFLVASKDRKIFFDSLRSSDGDYVFGKIYLDEDKQIKFVVHYGEEAKAELKRVSGGKMECLKESGTRIFIPNPEREVVEAIKSGEMLSYISNSRWETIKKYNAKIFVDAGKGKKFATIPYWYEDEVKGVEGREYTLEIIKEATQYKIKRLVLRYAPNLDLPDSIRGIAIQRGGMTIERQRVEELVHEEKMNEVYGWLEMEGKPLEEEMKTLCENPQHFDFSWQLKPAKYLRDYLKTKVREFARELKIIDSDQAKKNKIQKDAEAEALKLLGPLFKKLGLFGRRKGKKHKEVPERKENEPLRLSIADIEFPNDSRRVNYEQEIARPYVMPINEFGEEISVLVRIYIISPAGSQIETLQEKEIILQPGKGPKVGPDLLKITKKYAPGGYSIRAKMVSLEEKKKALPGGERIEKGTVLYDRINQKFYVETDPPEAGPFEFQARSREDKNYLFEWETEGDGHIIFYNDIHPLIKPLLSDATELRNYLMEQAVIIAFQIKIEEIMADDDGSDEEITSLVRAKDVTGVWQLLLRRYSAFMWDLKYDDDKN
ncbi:MAG TPA: hypothetical protein VMA75_04985 [Candidatus Paceibacterota bacterium]|nr:hypothetical protein [Candidatus Paceibacterota bacterium]